MKRLLLVMCVVAGLAACGDGYDNGSDRDSTGINSPGDQMRPDTTNLNDTTSYDRATNPRDTM